MTTITFNRPYATGKEFDYISHAIQNMHISGDGSFTKKCQNWLSEHLSAPQVLLTHSCTAALEMFPILTNLKAGDEVIMPSYTFVSTANAFVLRGCVPVFVDIREDTLNLDENLIEEAITEKTKAICVMHYGGISCEMDKIMQLAKKYDLHVFEDAAHCLFSSYKGKQLGSFGSLSAVSFHETKNIISGEGGALIVNDENYFDKAQIVRQKGTNREAFLRGEVDKYTWVDVGSSYLPSDIIAAFLWAQIEHAEQINAKRHKIWETYFHALKPFEDQGFLRLPVVPEGCQHSAHLFYLLMKDEAQRDHMIEKFREKGIQPVFHYIPLHSAPAGQKYGKVAGELEVTEKASKCLLRLPMFVEMTEEQQDYVIKTLQEIIES